MDEEAEELEHAISDKVLAKIDDLLKNPQVDPHGDPIPSPRDDIADAVAITSKNHPALTLGTSAAAKILVEAV